MDARVAAAGRTAPAILDGASAPAPGDGQPIQFVDVHAEDAGRARRTCSPPTCASRDGLYHYEAGSGDGPAIR